jgi:signal transduction histidine kinase
MFRHRVPLLVGAVASIGRSRGARQGVGFAAILGFSLLAMFCLMFWRSTDLLFKTLDRTVVEQLELLSARPPDMLPFMIESRMHHGPEVVTRVGLFDKSGASLVGDIAALPAKLILNGRVQAIAAPQDASEQWRAAGKRLLDGRTLVVARDASEILMVRADLLRGAALGIVPAVLLSLAGGALVGFVTEQRLRRINAISQRIIEGELDQRLPERPGGDELDRLCRIVNSILVHLDAVIEALRSTGENIAHDLRTPLTSLRARLERSIEMAGLDTPVGRTIEQSLFGVDQALSIVTALLRISEIRHVRQTSAFEAFDVAEVVRDVADAFQPVAEEKRVALTYTANLIATTMGDRQLIIEALANLIDNAVKFTPEHGEVLVTLGGASDRPVVVIADNGPGVPPHARPEVFQRFYRLDQSRATPGSGLGLHLVSEIVRLHGFSISLDDNDPGCRIELRLWKDDGTLSGHGAVGTVQPHFEKMRPASGVAR